MLFSYSQELVAQENPEGVHFMLLSTSVQPFSLKLLLCVGKHQKVPQANWGSQLKSRPHCDLSWVGSNTSLYVCLYVYVFCKCVCRQDRGEEHDLPGKRGAAVGSLTHDLCSVTQVIVSRWEDECWGPSSTLNMVVMSPSYSFIWLSPCQMCLPLPLWLELGNTHFNWGIPFRWTPGRTLMSPGPIYIGNCVYIPAHRRSWRK